MTQTSGTNVMQSLETDHAPASDLALISVPLFWPLMVTPKLAELGGDALEHTVRFLAEEAKIHHELKPSLATANRVMLDLRTMVFRDYSKPGGAGVPTVRGAVS
jgi:hypothetical protein